MDITQNPGRPDQAHIDSHVAATTWQPPQRGDGSATKTVTPGSGMGGGGYHPSIAKHVQAQKPIQR